MKRKQGNRMTNTIHAIGCLKERNGIPEVFIFTYRIGMEAEILRALGRAASDPELDFNWNDAAMLADKVNRFSRKIKRFAWGEACT